MQNNKQVTWLGGELCTWKRIATFLLIVSNYPIINMLWYEINVLMFFLCYFIDYCWYVSEDRTEWGHVIRLRPRWRHSPAVCIATCIVLYWSHKQINENEHQSKILKCLGTCPLSFTTIVLHVPVGLYLSLFLSVTQLYHHVVHYTVTHQTTCYNINNDESSDTEAAGRSRWNEIWCHQYIAWRHSV